MSDSHFANQDSDLTTFSESVVFASASVIEGFLLGFFFFLLLCFQFLLAFTWNMSLLAATKKEKEKKKVLLALAWPLWVGVGCAREIKMSLVSWSKEIVGAYILSP